MKRYAKMIKGSGLALVVVALSACNQSTNRTPVRRAARNKISLMTEGQASASTHTVGSVALFIAPI